MIPALCLQFKFLSIACDELTSKFWLGDMPDDTDTFKVLYFLIVTNRASEEQLIVLSAIQSTSGEVHVHLLCHYSGLVVDRNLLLEQSATCITFLADVHYLRRKTVGNVNHARWAYASLS